MQLRNRGFKGARRLFRRAKTVLRPALLKARLLVPKARSPRHRLGREVIVSLTSYPARFAALTWTLRSLAQQSVSPDKIVLWIAKADEAALASRRREIESLGVQIEFVDDIRSYKKIIPALERYPEAILVTADDDVFYPRSWLAELLGFYREGEPRIVCHRAHMVSLTAEGTIGPYGSWKWETRHRGESASIFPTGVGGVLYSPRALAKEVVRRDLFEKFCPNGDDIWLLFMGKIASARYFVTGSRFSPLEWPGSQSQSLGDSNFRSGEAFGVGNDRQIRALEQYFGTPAWGSDDDSRQAIPHS